MNVSFSQDIQLQPPAQQSGDIADSDIPGRGHTVAYPIRHSDDPRPMPHHPHRKLYSFPLYFSRLVRRHAGRSEECLNGCAVFDLCEAEGS